MSLHRRAIVRSLPAVGLGLAAFSSGVAAQNADSAAQPSTDAVAFKVGQLDGEVFPAVSSRLIIQEQNYIQILTALQLTNRSDKRLQLSIPDLKLFSGFDNRAVFYSLQRVTGLAVGEQQATVVDPAQTARCILQFLSGRQDGEAAAASAAAGGWFDCSGNLAINDGGEQNFSYSLGFRVTKSSFE